MADGAAAMIDLLGTAAALTAAGEPFVLATVVWRRAPSSGQAGSKAIVRADGSVQGWVGGACAQPTLVRQALETLADRQPRLVFLGPSDEFDGVLREGVVRVPMACESEGALEIYLEPVLPLPRVVVVGDSTLTSTLVALAGDLGWHAASVDDPAALVGIDGRTAVVVATQGRYDEAAVQAALATPACYVGLVASRRRAAAVVGYLRADGVPEDALARLRAPAGLDLGSVNHEEISVAVLAELVALRASGQLTEVQVPRQRAVEAVDPVCGMTVSIDDARHVSSHAGRSVFFCAASCKRTFDTDPEKYAVPVG